MSEQIIAQPGNVSSMQLGFQPLKVSEERVEEEFKVISDRGDSSQELDPNQGKRIPLFAENKRVHPPKIGAHSNTQSDCSTSLLSVQYQGVNNELVEGKIERRSNADHERVNLQRGGPADCIEDDDSVECKCSKGVMTALRLLPGGKANKSDGSVVRLEPEAQDNQAMAAETKVGSPSREKEKLIEVQKGKTAEHKEVESVKQSGPLQIEALKSSNAVVVRAVVENRDEGNIILCSTELKGLKNDQKREQQAADFSEQAELKRHEARELISTEKVKEGTISILGREDAQNTDNMVPKIEENGDYKEELRDEGVSSLETASGKPRRRTRRRRRRRPSSINQSTLENRGSLDTSSTERAPEQLCASASTSPATSGTNIRNADLLKNGSNASSPISSVEGPASLVESLRILISEVKLASTVPGSSPPIKRNGTPTLSLPSMCEEEWPSLAQRKTLTETSPDFVSNSPLHKSGEVSSTQSKQSTSKLVTVLEASDVIPPRKLEMPHSESPYLQGKTTDKQSGASFPPALKLNGNQIVECTQQVPFGVGGKKKRRRPHKKRHIFELAGTQFMDVSNHNKPSGESSDTTKLDSTLASAPIVHHSLPPRPQPTPDIQMSVLKSLHNAATILATTSDRSSQARPLTPPLQLRNWKSEYQRLKERHNNIITTLKILRCHCSPAVPWDFNQYMQHKNEIAGTASKQEKGKLTHLEKVKQDKTDEPTKWREWVDKEMLSLWDDWKSSQNVAAGNEAHKAMGLMPCMGGKIFPSRNSAALSQLTTWSPQEWSDNRLDFPGIHRFQTLKPAYWPRIPEMRAAANRCRTNPQAAALPTPKGSSFDWNLGTPTPFGKKPGEEAVLWTGRRGEEVPWQERARVYIPELDRVEEGRAERNLYRMETKWVGKALWEAIRE